MGRYRGWAFFFGLCFTAVASYILCIASHRPPAQDRTGVIVIGLLVLAARFITAPVTGRAPGCIAGFIDADT